MSSKMPTLAKPTLSRTQSALAFAEAGSKRSKSPTKEETEGKRVFFAPEGYRRLTINLPEALHKRLKMAAIEQDCTATDIIERLLGKELE